MQENKIGAVRDRLAVSKEQIRFTRKQVIILGLLATVSIAGGLLTAERTMMMPVKTEDKNRVEKASAAQAPKEKAALARTEKIKYFVVHVAGDVVDPGVRQVKAGSRVSEAIEAAGGPLDRTALDNLNLAAKVSDGQKILVKKDIEPTLETGVANSVRLVSINGAGLGELEKLDGIGPVLAQRIISWREQHGGFTSISQLNRVDGIGPKKFARLKEQVLLY